MGSPSRPEAADQRSRLLDDYAAIVRRKAPLALERTLQRTGSVLGRDIVSHLATDGVFDTHGLMRRLQESEDPTALELDPRWAATLAWVLASQDLKAEDRSHALAVLDHVWATSGPTSLGAGHRRLYLDLLHHHGRWDRLRLALPEAGLAARETLRYQADLANPHLADDHRRDPRTWLDRLNEVTPAEMGSVSVVSSSPTPFDGLWARGRTSPRDPGLVSIIVSVFNPGPELRTSVDSLCRQTYRNLEIIIVDDASTNGPDDLLAEIAARDDRITVIRLGQNGGTYRCRNYALSVAAGVYVTFQDDDDWSHPDRIAHQVAALEGDRSVVAVMVRCLRATSELGLVKVGYREHALNTSSLMLRRARVLARVGFYDAVRKGADTEYVRRVIAVFGAAAVKELPQTLSFVRVGVDSLSSSDFKPGWQHRSRWFYKMLYSRWHASLSDGAGDAVISSVVNDTRPFPVSRAMDPTRTRPRRYDAVFVGDWRSYGGPQRSMLAEIAALIAEGRVVGVSHLEAFRFMVENDRPLCEPLIDLVEKGSVDYVLTDEDIEVDQVIIRYPPVLQFVSTRPARWRCASVLIVANQAPFEFDGSDIRYDPITCTSTATAVFGRVPLWLPQGPVVREVLEPVLTDGTLAPFDMPGVLDVAEWPERTETGPPRDRPVVIGRVSRDSVNKFPTDPGELRSAYTIPGTQVRMLGAAVTVPALLGTEVPDNWELLPANAVDVQEFLAGLDVFVYFDNPSAREAFGRVVLEAIASGCLVVLPPRYRNTFGDAAIYCLAHEVSDVVSAHVDDVASWRRQARRARAAFEREFSYQAQLDRSDRASAIAIAIRAGRALVTAR